MAGTQQVDDSFLDEVDDSFLDEPPPDPNFSVTVRDNEPSRWESLLGRVASAGLGAAHGTAAGWADEGAGVLGAAAEKIAGSDKSFGDLYREGRDYARKFYDAERAKDPTMFGAGDFMGNVVTGIAATPLLPGGVAATGAKALARQGFIQGAAQGLGNSTADNAMDMAGDAAGGAIIGAAGGAIAPTIARGVSGAVNAIRHPIDTAKSVAGSVAGMPRRGLDKLYAMLGGSADNVAAPVASRADDFAEQMAMQADAPPVPDNVVPMRPQTNAADVDTKITPAWRRLLQDEHGGSGYQGPRKFKSKQDAFRQIVEASGVDDLGQQSAQAGHFDEINRIVGRKVNNTQDAFDALVAASAKKRGKSHGTHDWEDVQTAIRELRKIEGLEDLQLPAAVQDAILPVEKEPSFNFGANRDPDFLRKSSELAKMLGQNVDEAAPPLIRNEAGLKSPLAPPRAPATDADKPPGWDMQWKRQIETPDRNTQIEALERLADEEMGLNRAMQRQGWDVDSRPAIAATEMAGEKTGQGAADMYKPMGVSPEAIPVRDTSMTSKPQWIAQSQQWGDNVPLTPEKFDEIAASVNQQGAGKGGGWYRPETVNREPIPVPGYQPQGTAPPPKPAPNLQGGRERLEKLLGYAASAKAGMSMDPLGVVMGPEAGKRVVGMADKFADKAAVFGQKLLSDPAKLQQLEMQGGQIGKAAGWIMDGYREGGESAATARAYVVSSQPWWREQFVTEDSAP